MKSETKNDVVPSKKLKRLGKSFSQVSSPKKLIFHPKRASCEIRLSPVRRVEPKLNMTSIKPGMSPVVSALKVSEIPESL